MQIEIVSGAEASDKSTKLRQLEQEYLDAGKDVLRIRSEFSLGYLRRRIVLASLQGYAAILLNDCSPDKLKKLKRAQKEIEERMDIDLTLYVAERA